MLGYLFVDEFLEVFINTHDGRVLALLLYYIDDEKDDDDNRQDNADNEK